MVPTDTAENRFDSQNPDHRRPDMEIERSEVLATIGM
jgi:hypothetical protein